MSNWTNDTLRLATLAATQIERWPEFSVHQCCELCGYENTKMFLSAYMRRYGHLLAKQLRYADEWLAMQEDE